MNKEEAIEIIRKNWPDASFTQLRVALETLIPELKDSEDERIRKEIIEFIQWSEDRGMTRHDFHQAKRPSEWIAYLEKQKEQKHYWKPTETDVALFNKAVTTNKALTPAERALLDIIRSKFSCCRATNCGGIVQKEQKPHLELKTGKWYICHRAFCARADHLTVKEGERFQCEKDGIVKGFVIKEPEKYFKECSAPEPMEKEQKPAEWSESDILMCNAALELLRSHPNLMASHGINKSSVIRWLQSFRPQKQGFIDDICSKAGIAIPYLDGNQWCILKGDNIQAGVVGFGDTKEDALANFIKDVSIPQQWSEEDDEMYARVVRRYTDYEGVIMRTKEESIANKMLDAMAQEEIWLKSISSDLKKRNEAAEKLYSNEWSEEDEKNRRSLNTKEIKVGDTITYFRNGKKGIMLVSSFDSGIYPRCKWGITDIDGTAYGDWTPGSGPYYAATEKEKQQLYDTMPIEVKNWLKSLKPHWKPSEEQMDRLFSIVAALRKDYCDDMADFLTDLYADLKKLGVKEEPEYYQHFDPDC